MAQNLVQYIVVRKDLLKSGWPTGALITQACHACVAVIHQFYDKEDTQKYLGDVDRMHKVTLEVNLGFFNYCQGNILFFLISYICFRIIIFIHHRIKSKSGISVPPITGPGKSLDPPIQLHVLRYLNLQYIALPIYLQKSFI